MKRAARAAFIWHCVESALVITLAVDGWNYGLVMVLLFVAVIGWAWSLAHLR